MSIRLSERDEVTLSVLALMEETTVAEQRRRALAAYASQACTCPDVTQIVRLILASRRAREAAPGNVITLRAAR
jgi:hypothetical protein